MGNPDSQKRLERAHLEMVKMLRPGLFPVGAIEQPPPPAADLSIRADYGILGIEHTQLFQSDSGAPHSPNQVEQHRRKLIQQARKRYLALGGVPVAVNAGIKPGPWTDGRALVGTLAEFVHANQPAGAETLLFNGSNGRPPDPFQTISLWRCPDSREEWNLFSVGSTESLTRAHLAAAIRSKQDKVPGYRRHARCVWLLVVSDIFPSSSDFSTPREAGSWSFDHPFDKVLLYCRGSDEVLEF